MEPVGNPKISRAKIVAVALATYRRPQGIRLLFDALLQQDFGELRPDKLIFCVSSNNALQLENEALERDLREKVERASRTPEMPKLEFLFAVESERSIPRARNSGVNLALLGGAEVLAFVDDDELPASSWLCALLRARCHYGAAIVAGPVLPRFESPPPAWATELALFERKRPATGTRLDVAYTHNVLVDKSVFEKLGGFDERFKLNGGDDSAFFKAASAAGFQIVFCDEAEVSERVPSSRLRISFVLRRSFRFGNSEGYRVVLQTVPTRERLVVATTGISIAVKAFLRLGVGLFQAPPFSRTLSVLLRLSYGCGLIAGTLGIRHDFYERSCE